MQAGGACHCAPPPLCPRARGRCRAHARDPEAVTEQEWALESDGYFRLKRERPPPRRPGSIPAFLRTESSAAALAPHPAWPLPGPESAGGAFLRAESATGAFRRAESAAGGALPRTESAGGACHRYVRWRDAAGSEELRGLIQWGRLKRVERCIEKSLRVYQQVRGAAATAY